MNVFLRELKAHRWGLLFWCLGIVLLVSAGMFMLAGWAYTLTTIVLLVRILADGWAIYTHGATSTVGYAAIANLVVSLIGLWYFRRGVVKAAFGK